MLFIANTWNLNQNRRDTHSRYESDSELDRDGGYTDKNSILKLANYCPVAGLSPWPYGTRQSPATVLSTKSDMIPIKHPSHENRGTWSAGSVFTKNNYAVRRLTIRCREMSKLLDMG